MRTNKVTNWIFASLMALTTTFITSCGSDEDGFTNLLPTPQFEDVSGRYTIANPSSSYASVELFASGEYLIVKRSYDDYSMTPLRGAFSTRAAGRATRFGNSILGTFQKLDNQNFLLEGFGRLQLKTTESQHAEIIFQPAGGQEESVSAKKTTMMPDNDKTNALCRTWKMVKLRERGYECGEAYDDIYTPDMNDPELLVDITFSKSGTYINTYQDMPPFTAMWKWENIGKGIIRSSQDNIWYNGDEGNATITFLEDNKIKMVEFYKDHNTGEWSEITIEAIDKMSAGQ